MLLSAAWILLLLLTESNMFNGRWFIHPVSLMLFLWLAWMITVTPLSEIIIPSVNQVAAKGWYILAFFIGPLLLLKNPRLFRNMLLAMLIALTGVCVFVMIRHGLTGFSFAAINPSLPESYRNHVVYSAIIVVILPYILYVSSGSKRRRIWLMVSLFLMAALFFAYTRAAYLAFIAMIVWYIVMKWKLVRLAIPIGLIGAGFLVHHLISDDNYLDYAPEYTKTISHKEFGNLLEATTQGQDVSSMERVYRWVAGYHMAKKKPWTGFGPNNFPVLYKPCLLYTSPSPRD